MNPKPDIDYLRRVLARIDGNPELWDQNVLAQKTECGTACCVAGHTVALAGYSFYFDIDGSSFTTTDGVGVWGLARTLLGISEMEAGDLFDGDNDRQGIQLVAEEIALRVGETL